jgi:hypothetical protein
MASELQKAVNALVAREPGWKTFLPPAPPVTPIPAQRGVGVQQAVQGSAGGGGGPTDMALGAGVTLTSSDGLFTWEYSQTVVVTIGGAQYKLQVVG